MVQRVVTSARVIWMTSAAADGGTQTVCIQTGFKQQQQISPASITDTFQQLEAQGSGHRNVSS